MPGGWMPIGAALQTLRAPWIKVPFLPGIPACFKQGLSLRYKFQMGEIIAQAGFSVKLRALLSRAAEPLRMPEDVARISRRTASTASCGAFFLIHRASINPAYRFFRRGGIRGFLWRDNSRNRRNRSGIPSAWSVYAYFDRPFQIGACGCGFAAVWKQIWRGSRLGWRTAQ